MIIDFADFVEENGEAVIHPRDIFFTLNKDPNFSFPRDIQTEVMNLWFGKRAARDSVIKLNVGSGKTLVGLLLLQSSLNENAGPSLYVTPDKQLTQQVVKEAKALGIGVTEDPRDPTYEAGEQICVTNVYKLFNGLSIFGVEGNENKIGIGTVVVDDAHACVSTIANQFRIVLPNSHDAYKALFAILKEDIKGYNEAAYLDLESGDPRAYMEVPFWYWAMHQSDILHALHKYRADDALKFTYPFLREVLPQCRCVIGGQKLEIEPPFPVTDLVTSFRRAKRRIYMTATQSDDSVMVTHFGADPDKLGAPLVPLSSQSMGERMILMPQELNTDLTNKDIRTLLVDLAETHNIVVIVPSEQASKFWKDNADQILMGDEVVPGIERLKEEHVGLTVLMNRYDGIDLPGNACRVLVIVDLPEVSSYAEIVDGEILSNSAHNLKRQIERIEQGMGRGVRSNDDYCVVILLGAKLIRRLRSTEGEELLTPATKAQLNLSRKIAKKLEVPSADDIKDVILQCLNRDAGWIKVSKKELVGIEVDDKLRLDPSKLAIRKAFDAVRFNQHVEAMSILSAAVNEAEEDQVKAWLLSRKAVFEHSMDASGAQKTLMKARSLEYSVMKPILDTTYKKLDTLVEKQQATILVKNHTERFLDPVMMKLFADELCSDLQFGTVSADKFEASINELAWFFGILVQRPEKEFNEGPDNLWALPNGKFLVIECKNCAASDNGISKKDAGQLGQSVAWFEIKYLNTECVPVIIHPKKILGPSASLVAGMRVMDVDKLEKLKNTIKRFARQIADPGVFLNTAEVAERLESLDLNADDLVNTYTKAVR